MARIKLFAEVKQLQGFEKQAFIEQIEKSLKEVDAALIYCNQAENGYLLAIEYVSTALGVRPVVACLQELGTEYPHIEIGSLEFKD